MNFYLKMYNRDTNTRAVSLHIMELDYISVIKSLYSWFYILMLSAEDGTFFTAIPFLKSPLCVVNYVAGICTLTHVSLSYSCM